jgi:hypothetical protein
VGVAFVPLLGAKPLFEALQAFFTLPQSLIFFPLSNQ